MAIESKVFNNLDELNEFIKTTRRIEVINITRVYENYEISNNSYGIKHAGYELFYRRYGEL